MTTKVCTYCAMSIPAAASVCPYCRKRLGLTLGKILMVVFVLGILMAIILPATSKREIPPVKTPEQIAKEIEENEQYEAKIYSKAVVESTLKAPSTAKWPREDKVIADKGIGNTWLVYGYVDAQNGFGAMLRTKYKLTVSKFKGEWKVLDTQFY